MQVSERLVAAADKKNIAYIDANNLYAHAMSGTLPTGGHVILTRAEIDAID